MDMRQGVKRVKDGMVQAKDSVLGGIGKGIDTVTGKEVIEHVTKFAQEADAVNTAIVTRIYEVLDRQSKLDDAFRHAQVGHQRTRNLLRLSLALNALCILAVVYILGKTR